MRTPSEILLAVKQAGGRIEPAGDKLRVLLPVNCPPEIRADLRQHKRELLDLLEAKAANLPPDCALWMHVANQVLAGEFLGADKSTVESLIIGLRGISNPLCQRALARLPKNPQKPAAD
ncbi:MAG TPA: hypothetical protein VGO59_09145 [Verrucomicrobiae bacterium]|jgi:hypothetical protein